MQSYLNNLHKIQLEKGNQFSTTLSTCWWSSRLLILASRYNKQVEEVQLAIFGPDNFGMPTENEVLEAMVVDNF
jgi:hypothetical protein